MNAPTTFPELTPDPALQPTGRGDGWTPDRQRAFLDALAGGLHVEHACRVVGLSPSSAYALRQRSRGAAFALGWDAALLLQRQRIVDDLTTRAVQGHVTTITRGDGSTTERHQYDNRLSTYMLTRLDRLAEHTDDGQNGGRRDQAHAARLAAGEWDQYLDLVAADAGPMATAQFIRHRDNDDAIASVRLARTDRYLRAGAGCAKEVATDDLDLADRANWTAEQWARADAAGLLVPAPQSASAHKPPLPPVSPVAEDELVWWCDVSRAYHTSFPPPDDFDGEEIGYYGDDHYERALSDDEAKVIAAVMHESLDPEADDHAEAEVERDRWFDELHASLARELLEAGTATGAASEDRAAMDPTPVSDVPSTPAGTGPATGDDPMSIFGKIKDAIFGHKTAAPAPAPAAPHPQPTNAPPAPVAATAPAPAPAQAVDVEAVLTSVAQGKGNPNLNWRTSIVDLMKLLDLDSSLSNREELATELGYTGAKNGSAEMNMWLSKAVMRELEKNGGKVPANLKD